MPAPIHLKPYPLNPTSGYALLSLIIVVIMLFTLIFIPLQLLTTVNVRSSTSAVYSRQAFYGAESAIHDAVSRILYSGYSWPGTGQTITENLNFSGVDVTRTTTDNANQTYAIDAVGTYHKISRQLTADIAANSQTASVDVVLVIDNSGSMNNQSGTPCDQSGYPDCQPLEDAREAAKYLIDQIIANGTDAQIAVFKFNNFSTRIFALSNGLSAAKAAIDSIRYANFTNIGDGFYQAQQELQNNGRPTAVPFIVLLTDGGATYKGIQGSTTACNGGSESPIHNTCTDNNDPESAINRANDAKQLGYNIFTVGLGVINFSTNPSGCTTPPCGIQAVARDTLIQSASAPDYYYEAPSSGDLQSIYNAIATRIIESPSISIREVTN